MSSGEGENAPINSMYVEQKQRWDQMNFYFLI